MLAQEWTFNCCPSLRLRSPCPLLNVQIKPSLPQSYINIADNTIFCPWMVAQSYPSSMFNASGFKLSKELSNRSNNIYNIYIEPWHQHLWYLCTCSSDQFDVELTKCIIGWGCMPPPGADSRVKLVGKYEEAVDPPSHGRSYMHKLYIYFIYIYKYRRTVHLIWAKI